MKENKTQKEMRNELYDFKNSYSNILYLMKLFHFLYFQVNEMELYPEEDKYTAHNCLLVLSGLINNLLDKQYKQLIMFYKEFENVCGDNS